MQRTSPKGSAYLVGYALFAAVLVLAYVLFVVWQQTVQVLTAFAIPREAQASIDGTIVVVIGIALFLYVVVAETYLRGGVRHRDLRRRFARLVIPEVVLIVIGLAFVVLLLPR